MALIGPDGAGKSTIAREVVRSLGPDARYLYMGVNLETSSRMLPTTWLALAFKRWRGRSPQMTADWKGTDTSRRPSLARSAYSGMRFVAWLAEEWYRALLAALEVRRGHLVVFDRHFVYDYWSSHVRRRPGRTIAARLHGLVLQRLYPRPDFVVCLDAPAEVLHGRKQDQPVEWLEGRRREYLALATVGPEFAVVDATQPVAAVVEQITGMIRARRP